MALTRLGKYLFSHVCIACLAANLVWPCTVHAQITPSRDITILNNQSLPQWKLHWDMGREAVRKGDYAGGARYYELVLREKPEIEVARWEYCQILVELGKFQEASDILERLTETNPNRMDYAALAGSTALASGEYNRAVRHLGQVYSRRPEGEQGVVILQGLIKALKALNRKENAFVLMEQLRQRTPGDSPLLLDLARMANELGYSEKAEQYYSALIAEKQGGREALDEAARMFAARGKEDKAAPLWKRLLKEEPENNEYHRQLLFHYRKTAENDEALPHLLALLDGDEGGNPEMILETARIYSRDQKRADKALAFYERYMHLRPDDRVAAKELEATRRQIAGDLLPIVENDGAELLWRDLGNITKNRYAIYQYMAEDLEQQGKTEPLVKVLEILYRQPEGRTDELALRLGDLHMRAGRPEHALPFYENIKDKRYLTVSFYQRKGEIELSLGYDVAALDSFMNALVLQPAATDLRTTCIQLAGRLGFVEKLRLLARSVRRSPELVEADLPLYEAYIGALRRNGEFADVRDLADRLLAEPWLPERYRQKLLLEHARDLDTMGQPFAAQQTFRMVLAENDSASPGAIGGMIEHALQNGALEDAETLVAYYTGQTDSDGWKKRFGYGDRAFFVAYIHLRVEQGQSAAALEELARYLTEYRKAAESRQGTEDDILELELETVRLALKQGNKKLCLELVHHYEERGFVPPEMQLVKYIAAGNGTVNPEALITNIPGRKTGTGGAEQLLRLARASAILEKNTAAEVFLNELLHYYPQSMRGRIERADVRKRNFRLEAAAKDYQKLYLENSREGWLYDEYLRLEFRLGRYETIIAGLSSKKFEELPIEQQLLITRALYAVHNRTESFALYEKMLQPTVMSRFRESLAARKLPYTWQNKASNTSFWTMFRYEEPDQLDILNALSGDEGFLANIHSPQGVLAADLFESYRWEKIISSEYQARKALEENRYTVAEKQYRKEMDQGQSTEGLKDLARIYERLGEYNKQAEVYSYLEKRGEQTPEMQESIERNKIARMPTLGFNYEYLGKHGRDDQINLRKNSVGGKFQYLPGLNSKLELGFNELFFEPYEGEGESIEGRLVSASGIYRFNDKTSVDLGWGLQMLDSNSDSSAVYSFRLNRKLDQLLSGYVEYRHDIIDDTTEALDMGLTSDSALGGLVLETTSGFTLGTEYQRRWYEDDNIENRIYLWSSYAIYDELTTYEIKFSYEQFSNSEDDTATVSSTRPPVEEQILPYWSPDNYSQQLLSFKLHRLLKNQDEQERPPSSVSADFSVGYESEGDFLVAGGADIFLEIGSNFLVKGNLFYTESSDYHEESAAISLMYRW